MEFVKEYIDKINCGKSSLEYLKENKGFIKEKFGTEMNVIKDVIFEGTLLKMINEAKRYLDTQVKEKTYLGPDGTFVTEEEYPKFAEFLKNYKFVKEFGEGVNRMCNELEQVGLKDPAYYTNAFMLQAVIYNLNVEKAGNSAEKSAIEAEKQAIGTRKLAIGNKKLAIDAIKSSIEQQKYNEPTKENILKIYDEITRYKSC